MSKPRGRPRQYDEAQALAGAIEVFWEKGFSATSLDDLSSAMAMNRPSIYRAFGDKEAVYRRALAQFAVQMDEAFERTLEAQEDVRRGLAAFYREALAAYTAGPSPKGCLVLSTAVTAATSHLEIQNDLLEVIRRVDQRLELRLQQAVGDGQLNESTDTKQLAALAQSILHSLSLRARAGESPARLRKLLDAGVAQLLPTTS